MQRSALLLALALPLLAGACSDRAIYVERSGVNMKLAVNDDPSTPIEVNLGLQRGIVTVVPSLGEGSEGEALGEAGSLISGFDYVNGSSVPIAGGAEGLPASNIRADVSIRTSFASGDAASLISYPAEYRTDDDGNVILGQVTGTGAASATRAVTLVATAAGGVGPFSPEALADRLALRSAIIAMTDAEVLALGAMLSRDSDFIELEGLPAADARKLLLDDLRDPDPQRTEKIRSALRALTVGPGS